MEERYSLCMLRAVAVLSHVHCYMYTVVVVVGVGAGTQLNKQHAPAVDQQELARETERLDRE